MNLIEELKTILVNLDSAGLDYALCGGLAMAVYAFPRSTFDIDLMIERKDLEAVKAIAVSAGYRLDAGFLRLLEGQMHIYRLTKIDQKTSAALVLDLLLVSQAVLHVWNSRLRIEWDYGEISVVSPEGLIELKLLRNSGQDQDDIRHLRSIIHEN